MMLWYKGYNAATFARAIIIVQSLLLFVCYCCNWSHHSSSAIATGATAASFVTTSSSHHCMVCRCRHHCLPQHRVSLSLLLMPFHGVLPLLPPLMPLRSVLQPPPLTEFASCVAAAATRCWCDFSLLVAATTFNCQDSRECCHRRCH